MPITALPPPNQPDQIEIAQLSAMAIVARTDWESYFVACVRKYRECLDNEHGDDMPIELRNQSTLNFAGAVVCWIERLRPALTEDGQLGRA